MHVKELRNLWEQRKALKWALPCEEFDAQQSLLLLEDCSEAGLPLPGWEDPGGPVSGEPPSAQQVGRILERGMNIYICIYVYV